MATAPSEYWRGWVQLVAGQKSSGASEEKACSHNSGLHCGCISGGQLESIGF